SPLPRSGGEGPGVRGRRLQRLYPLTPNPSPRGRGRGEEESRTFPPLPRSGGEGPGVKGMEYRDAEKHASETACPPTAAQCHSGGTNPLATPSRSSLRRIQVPASTPLRPQHC